VTKRAESAAQTRQALLRAAAELLDLGGPDVVTLRAVGDGAGVSRSAAYRHFVDKDALLMALATDAWMLLADSLEAIVADGEKSADDAIFTALAALSDLGGARPHLYRLMFTGPAASPASVSAISAAERAQDAFIHLVSRVSGESRARPIAGVLLAAAHGLTDLDVGGHLPPDKWGADRAHLTRLLVTMIPHDRDRRENDNRA
jgi:AcrR family transcriptional regulator